MNVSPAERLTFVTVTFRAEDALLRLQARSMARFLDASAVERIIVIDNGSPGLGARARRSLLADYGSLAPRVRFGRAEELTALPSASGWTLQQVLKISVATTVETPWYVLLDAKNHFVRPATREDFVAPDGRARGGFHSYAAHPLLPRLRTTLSYLGLKESLVDRFPPTSTPFVMNTDVALSIIADVSRRSGKPFAEEFVDQNLSEFFLYSGWIAQRSGSWSEVFDGEAIQSPTVWGGTPDGRGVRAALDEVARWDAPLFAVHRRALGRLDATGTAMLSDFWTRRELFAGESEVRRFLRRARRERVLDAARSRLRRPLTR